MNYTTKIAGVDCIQTSIPVKHAHANLLTVLEDICNQKIGCDGDKRIYITTDAQHQEGNIYVCILPDKTVLTPTQITTMTNINEVIIKHVVEIEQHVMELKKAIKTLKLVNIENPKPLVANEQK